jgi:hypothetical protein
MFDAARDRAGRPLFPDHRTPGTPGYNLRRLLALTCFGSSARH